MSAGSHSVITVGSGEPPGQKWAKERSEVVPVDFSRRILLPIRNVRLEDETETTW
jgi:hypothetical protein